MDGSRVNPTPEPDVPPALPKTMRCTVTAVPIASSMPCRRRYSTARAERHESSTATVAASSCSRGSCGNAAAGQVREELQVLGAQLRPAPRSRARAGLRRPNPVTAAAVSPSNAAHVGAVHDLRELLHQAPIGIPDQARVAGEPQQPADACARTGRCRGSVSIMPGIETGAPDRTETRSGFLSPPNARPHACSSGACLPRARHGAQLARAGRVARGAGGTSRSPSTKAAAPAGPPPPCAEVGGLEPHLLRHRPAARCRASRMPIPKTVRSGCRAALIRPPSRRGRSRAAASPECMSASVGGLEIARALDEAVEAAEIDRLAPAPGSWRRGGSRRCGARAS